MAIPKLTISKDPQCRHKETFGFVQYATTAAGIVASCLNCGAEGTAQPDRERARFALLRVEAPPLIVP